MKCQLNRVNIPRSAPLRSPLLVSAQAVELLWVVFVYAGIEVVSQRS